jgi:alpha-beta hydrolase superfamily lysophospholipase
VEAGDREAEEVTWLRRRWPWLAGLAAATLLVAMAVAAALAWHFSSSVVVPDHAAWPEDVKVEQLSGGRIVLERNEETERPGLWGLEWQGGQARVGRMRDADEDTVTRTLLSVRGYLAAGMEVAVGSKFYTGDPGQGLGLPFRQAPVRGELGTMPAWLVSGRGDTWAIVVHGINDTPDCGLRLLPTLRRAGMPAMLITYRDDLGAPPSPDGHHHMGQTEWRDLEAAARYALRHGARHLVLVGYSMGGSIVAQFMQSSALAPRVAGLVLDAPALDWPAIFEYGAKEMGMPAIAAWPLERAVAARIEVDWDAVDAAKHPEAFQLPILIFHGADDDLIPISTSEEFAAELPDHVTVFRVPDAGHTQSWNVAPRLYERRFARFLRQLN